MNNLGTAFKVKLDRELRCSLTDKLRVSEDVWMGLGDVLVFQLGQRLALVIDDSIREELNGPG